VTPSREPPKLGRFAPRFFAGISASRSLPHPILSLRRLGDPQSAARTNFTHREARSRCRRMASATVISVQEEVEGLREEAERVQAARSAGRLVVVGRRPARRPLMSMVMDHSTLASCMAGSDSTSRTRRRERISQLSVLSTTHLRGSTTKPVAVSERLTMSTVSWNPGRAGR